MKYITVSPELERAVRAKMEETLDICRKHYKKDIPTPPLKFAQMGRRAGLCRYVMPSWMNNNKTSATIIINPDYFKNYYDDMLNDTVPHEVAHYISVFVHGKNGDGHGWLWKSVMSVIGIPSAERCHQYSLEGVKVRNSVMPFKYSCGCKDFTHELSSTKHKRHQAAVSIGRKGYRCRKCRMFLTFNGFNHNGKFIPAKKTETKEVPVFAILPIARPVAVPVIHVAPAPTVPDSGFRMVTRFVNGSLTNVRVPVNA